ncbi:DUF488 domain-containing protein [Candidatus Woesearchaeota archaeon]|nr:DUF488 domain-containing protein [Candidatus Woesearchaeota archaeon]
MVLKTKSILVEPSPNDGWRVCVMRKIRSEYKFDFHWQFLAPSIELLQGYKDKSVSWEEYVPRFRKEVLEPYSDFIKDIAWLATDRNITLLCYERTAEQCHRRLLAKECKKYEPNLEVALK